MKGCAAGGAFSKTHCLIFRSTAAVEVGREGPNLTKQPSLLQKYAVLTRRAPRSRAPCGAGRRFLRLHRVDDQSLSLLRECYRPGARNPSHPARARAVL